MKIALTGSSGTMGKQTLRHLMDANEVSLVRILLLDNSKERKYASKMKRLYKDRLEVLFGDVRNYQDCLTLTKDVDYVMHLAAVIPPMADHDDDLTVTTNFNGTKNMVDAVIENGNTAKFIHISTVALYGNRDESHPWGRVGDPLITSAFDVYGTSKLRAERYLLESNLKTWAVLRQTGVLYDNLLMRNISDGLMFHTPWNVPIEWATANDSGRLLKNIVLQDQNNECDDFWKDIYNIGGGQGCRTTGYETFDDGFKLIGGSCKSYFKPNWNAKRNFHCFWFSDSDILEEKFHFRSESCESFWAWFKSNHKIYGAAKILPSSLIRGLVIKPLLKNNNAPMYWVKHNMDSRVYAIFGDEKVSDKWEDFELLCEKESYASLKQYDKKFDLDHGYDESKEVLDIEDLRKAAEFRGGKLVSEEFDGDMFKKLKWQCHCGAIFEATPFTILKGGHWCPECSTPDKTWQFDMLAKKSPFIAQLWYDTHAKDEDVVYAIGENGPRMEKK